MSENLREGVFFDSHCRTRKKMADGRQIAGRQYNCQKLVENN